MQSDLHYVLYHSKEQSIIAHESRNLTLKWKSPICIEALNLKEKIQFPYQAQVTVPWQLAPPENPAAGDPMDPVGYKP